MALKAAMIMSSISIALLLIYGADVAAAGNGQKGFLPLDASVRGTIFGGISSIMLITSFFVTRKDESNRIGILIAIGGALIITGSLMILATRGGELDRRALVEFGSVLGIGIFISALGGIKIKKSSKSKSLQ